MRFVLQRGASVRYDDNTAETAVRSLTKLVVVHCSLFIGLWSSVFALKFRFGNAKYAKRNLQQPQRFASRILDFRFQISDPRLQIERAFGSCIRGFLPLRSLRLRSRFGNAKAAKRNPQRPQRFGVSNFKFQISDSLFLKLRVETDQIRKFLTFFLCELRVAFAFFAFTIFFETQRPPSETRQDRRGLHLESQISDLRFAIDQVPIAV